MGWYHQSHLIDGDIQKSLLSHLRMKAKPYSRLTLSYFESLPKEYDIGTQVSVALSFDSTSPSNFCSGKQMKRTRMEDTRCLNWGPELKKDELVTIPFLCCFGLHNLPSQNFYTSHFPTMLFKISSVILNLPIQITANIHSASSVKRLPCQLFIPSTKIKSLYYFPVTFMHSQEHLTARRDLWDQLVKVWVFNQRSQSFREMK